MTTFDINSDEDRMHFAAEADESVKGDDYGLQEIVRNIWGDSEEIFYRGLPCTITRVDRVGGEGEGDYAHIVFTLEGDFVPNGKAMYRLQGWYASHYGFEWDGPWEQVEPYEKTVIDYRSVN